MAELNSDLGKPPAFASSEALVEGARLLRRAFLAAPLHTARHDDIIISAEHRNPPVLQIQRGTAYSSHAFADGRRAIIDLLLPTDIVGVEHVVHGRANRDVIAASAVGYRVMPAQTLRELMAKEPEVAVRVLALMTEAKWRADRNNAAVTRMDAYGRLAFLLLHVYDRLRRGDLISRPSFNLDLTQDQIGDLLGITPVHVSRTLKRLRGERLAIVDRGTVIIRDLAGLRAIAEGLPATPHGIQVTNEVDSEPSVKGKAPVHGLRPPL